MVKLYTHCDQIDVQKAIIKTEKSMLCRIAYVVQNHLCTENTHK